MNRSELPPRLRKQAPHRHGHAMSRTQADHRRVVKPGLSNNPAGMHTEVSFKLEVALPDRGRTCSAGRLALVWHRPGILCDRSPFRHEVAASGRITFRLPMDCGA